jgi:hypothetical protein
VHCRLHFLALALAGCGARSSLEVGTDGGGSVQGARMFSLCNAPMGSMSIELKVDGVETCPPPATTFPGVLFFIWGQDLTTLQAGSVLAVGADTNAPLHGFIVQPDPLTNGPVPLVGGSLVFATFVPQQSATGTFDVTAMDGTMEQSGFEAVWCTIAKQVCPD